MKFNYEKIKSSLVKQLNGFNTSSALLKTMLPLAGLLAATEVKSQASINCTPAVSCSSADQIQSFSLNNIAATGNAGCSTNGYGYFPTPVWSLLMGNTYPWTATCGPTWSQGVAIWIDWNNDGFYTANEQVANSPSGLSHAGNITVPFTAVPGTNRRMRIRCQYATTIANTNNTACDSWTFGETEDHLVDIIAPPPCSGIPNANSIVTPTNGICPNSSAFLTLANTYTTFGYQYQWQSSTVSNVGPFTAIPNATLNTYATPNLTTTTYYQAVITCTNGNGVLTTTAGAVNVQSVQISTIPYYEDFEGIVNMNQLPNCSWSVTSPGTVARTYTSTQTQGRTARSGSKFASFYYSPSGSNQFYTNGIQMYAGVTYSVSMWFATSYYGDLNWTDLSIMIGQTQSATNQSVIVSSNGPAASSSYKSLAKTFTVATSGIYYVGIKGTSNGSCCGYHLNWDDLRIEIPCSLNTPTVSLSANTNTICAGEPVMFTATGADTYNWSNGATGDQVTIFPSISGLYTVVGTNSLSGCAAPAQSQQITVNPTPQLNIVAVPPVVCAGSPVVITAVGATTYTWSGNNGNNNFITVSPTVSTTYSVFGGNSFGCQAQVAQAITVNNLPNVTGASDRAEICRGEAAVLTGSGAVSYQWAASSLFIQNNVANISPNVTTTYTLTGTDANGCKKTTTVMQIVQECVGINEMTTTLAGVKIYPNPTGGEFTIELNNGADKMIEVTDVTGRVVLTNSSKEEMINVNINNLSNGIYYVKIQSQNAVEVIKVIKN